MKLLGITAAFCLLLGCQVQWNLELKHGLRQYLIRMRIITLIDMAISIQLLGRFFPFKCDITNLTVIFT